MCRHLPNAPNDQPYPAIFGLKVKARLPSWTSARRTEAPATTVAQHGPNNRVSEPVFRHRLARPHSHEAAGGPMTSHPSARCRIDSARSVGASANGFSCFGPSAGAPDKEPDGSLGGANCHGGAVWADWSPIRGTPASATSNKRCGATSGAHRACAGADSDFRGSVGWHDPCCDAGHDDRIAIRDATEQCGYRLRVRRGILPWTSTDGPALPGE